MPHSNDHLAADSRARDIGRGDVVQKARANRKTPRGTLNSFKHLPIFRVQLSLSLLW